MLRRHITVARIDTSVGHKRIYKSRRIADVAWDKTLGQAEAVGPSIDLVFGFPCFTNISYISTHISKMEQSLGEDLLTSPVNPPDRWLIGFVRRVRGELGFKQESEPGPLRLGVLLVLAGAGRVGSVP